MSRLRACYGIPVMDDDLWKANVARYHEVLSEAFQPPVIIRALEGAWKHHTDHFPTLGKLYRSCETARKDLPADREALPFPRHDHSPETMAAKERAAAYVAQALGAAAPDPDKAD